MKHKNKIIRLLAKQKSFDALPADNSSHRPGSVKKN